MIQQKQTILTALIIITIAINIPFVYSNNITIVNNTQLENNTPTLNQKMNLNQPGDIIYLSTTGNDDNTGEDWNNSVATLQQAINLVNNDGTIIIAEGTYTQPIRIEKYVSIRSNKEPPKTILTNQGSSTITIRSNTIVTIEGICFQNCSADSGSVIRNYGTLTCNNCVFENCKAENGDGGAILNIGELYVNNCKFLNNSAKQGNGGVISNRGTTQTTYSHFQNNKANFGGVIYNYNGQCTETTDNNTFKNCNFTYNTANQGNIAYTDNCTFSAILFDTNYFNPNTPQNFVGLITNMNQIIPPLLQPVNAYSKPTSSSSGTITQNTETNPPINNTNNISSKEEGGGGEGGNHENSQDNIIPMASLALSSISLITTLALLAKSYFLTPANKSVDSGMSQQFLGNSIITYDMLEKIEFESGNARRNKELNDLADKIRSNPNCCPCCTSVLYMLSLLQTSSISTVTKIEKWGVILEFILGPIMNLYSIIKNHLRK